MFGDFKPVDAKVMTDRYTGKSRGFGFVYFDVEEDRSDAIAKMHDYELDGRRMSVREAVPQSEMPRGGRRGGGRGRRDFDRRGGRFDDRRSSYRSDYRDYRDRDSHRSDYRDRDYRRRDDYDRDYSRRSYDAPSSDRGYGRERDSYDDRRDRG